ncbi:uncharacterized protein [Dysidea avara]|uniref:uncharacterized protein n=1 Tax=Dysidea avara TaxID=196820 RepID=UPI00331FF9EA
MSIGMSLEPKKPTCVNLSQLRRNAQISRKGKKSGGKRQGDYIVIAAPDAKINKMTSGTKTYKDDEKAVTKPKKLKSKEDEQVDCHMKCNSRTTVRFTEDIAPQDKRINA